MKTAKELREERAKIFKTMETLRDRANDEKHQWTGEDQAEWKRCNDDYNQYTRQIETIEQVEAYSADQRTAAAQARNLAPEPENNPENRGKRKKRNRPTDEQRSILLDAWFRSSFDHPLSRKHIKTCRQFRVNPRAKTMRMGIAGTQPVRTLQARFRDSNHRAYPAIAADQRALSIHTPTAGAVITAPDELIRNLEVNMLTHGPMLRTSEIIRTAQGNEMSWPTADDTSNEADIVGENTSSDGSTDPTWGTVIWGAHKFRSKMIKYPSELSTDSVLDLPAILGQMLGERLGRGQNTKYTTGTGVKEPRGWTIAATLGVTAASATVIAADEIIDLEHSVDPSYRSLARYQMHDNILLDIRKKKDGDGRYLFQSSLIEGGPDRVNGYPLDINQKMASAVATGNITIGFGQFFMYKIRQVQSVRFRQLDERYADLDQSAVIAFLRADGNLLDAGTPPIKYLKQA